jgi:transposase
MESAHVVVGVDTHRDLNVAVALDPQGRFLGSTVVATCRAGHAELLSWARGHGPLAKVGVEGTGSYGAGLSRFLQAAGVAVLEVERPERRGRSGAGKTDFLDAERAARSVLANQVRVLPKGGNGAVESLRVLWTARRGAVKARTQAANQLHGLVVTAPDGLRQQLRSLSCAQLVSRATRWRPGQATSPGVASRLALRSVARRHLELTAEVKALDRQIHRLVEALAPALLSVTGVGYETAATLLVTAGDNPERLRSEAAFAQLCGVAPIPASSGKTVRHRLNRAGDRQANRALFLIVMVRMFRDRRTQTYVARRTTEGRSKQEIIRCLKRYVARELYALLPQTAA